MKEERVVKGRIATAWGEIRGWLTSIEGWVFIGILMTLFFLPLSEKLKAAGFWISLFFWFVRLYKTGPGWREIVPPMGWPLLLIAAVALFSAMVSDYPSKATRGALDALRCALFFLIVADTVRSYRQLKIVLIVLVGGMSIGGIAAIHKYFTEGFSLTMLSLGEKNSTAQVIAFFLSLLMGVFLCLKKDVFLRLVLIGAVILSGYVFVLTYARGIWGGALVMLGFYTVILRNWKVPALVIGLIGVTSAGMSYSGVFTEKVQSLKSPFTAPNMVARYEIWEETFVIIKDHPYLGIGLKTYSHPDVRSKYKLTNPTNAHNMFLNVAVEIGIFGLASLLYWLLSYGKELVFLYGKMTFDLNRGLWMAAVGCYAVLWVGGIAHPMLWAESSLMLMTVLGLMYAGFRIEHGMPVQVYRRMRPPLETSSTF